MSSDEIIGNHSAHERPNHWYKHLEIRIKGAVIRLSAWSSRATGLPRHGKQGENQPHQLQTVGLTLPQRLRQQRPHWLASLHRFRKRTSAHVPTPSTRAIFSTHKKVADRQPSRGKSQTCCPFDLPELDGQIANLPSLSTQSSPAKMSSFESVVRCESPKPT